MLSHFRQRNPNPGNQIHLSVSWANLTTIITLLGFFNFVRGFSFAVRVIKWLLMHLEIFGGKCVSSMKKCIFISLHGFAPPQYFACTNEWATEGWSWGEDVVALSKSISQIGNRLLQTDLNYTKIWNEIDFNVPSLIHWTLTPSFPGQTKNGYNQESRNTGTSASNTSLIQLSSLSIQ
jgi:hypothetical protein